MDFSNQQLRLRIYGGAPPEGSHRGQPLRISLDDALANLERLSRMFVEPDGSFLWTGGHASGDSSWQLEGNLYDDGRHVQYVDVAGDCPEGEWTTFLAALGESLSTVALQLLDQDRFVAGQWLVRRRGVER
ncbi:MAG: hypothetical protein ACTHOU_00475 [Aureliella sp.]